MPLIFSMLWLIAALVAAHAHVPGSSVASSADIVAAELSSAIPSKPQTAPAQTPVRFAVLEALHVKFKSMRADTGSEPALLPDSSGISIAFAKSAIRNIPCGASCAAISEYFSARAPPARAA
ncbi:MAG: hypothetical protein ACRECW_00615 [Phyllobacterium sp.]